MNLWPFRKRKTPGQYIYGPASNADATWTLTLNGWTFGRCYPEGTCPGCQIRPAEPVDDE